MWLQHDRPNVVDTRRSCRPSTLPEVQRAPERWKEQVCEYALSKHRAVRIRVVTAATPAQRSAGARTQDEISTEASKVSDAKSRKTLAATLHHHRIIIPSAQSVFVEISGLALQVPDDPQCNRSASSPLSAPTLVVCEIPLGRHSSPSKICVRDEAGSPRRKRRTRRWRLQRETSGWQPWSHLFLEMREAHFQMNSPTFSACGDMRNEDGAHADIVQEH